MFQTISFEVVSRFHFLLLKIVHIFVWHLECLTRSIDFAWLTQFEKINTSMRDGENTYQKNSLLISQACLKFLVGLLEDSKTCLYCIIFRNVPCSGCCNFSVTSISSCVAGEVG